MFLETAKDDMESRIFTSGGGLNLNSTTLTLLGRIFNSIMISIKK